MANTILANRENGFLIMQRLIELVGGVVDALNGMTIRLEGRNSDGFQISCNVADFTLSGVIGLIDCWIGLKDFDATRQFVASALEHKMYPEQTATLLRKLSDVRQMLYTSDITTVNTNLTESFDYAFAQELSQVYASLTERTRFEQFSATVDERRQLWATYRGAMLGIDDTPLSKVEMALSIGRECTMHNAFSLVCQDVARLKQLLDYESYSHAATRVDLSQLFGWLLELESLCYSAANTRRGLFDAPIKGYVDAPKAEFFSLVQVDAIHHAVSGRQIEEISPSDLFSILNLRHSSAAMAIRPGERGRACYLIYILGEMLPHSDKAQWRQAMCDQLGISKRYYLSKYRKAVSDDCTKADIDFVHRMEDVNTKLREYQN
jgi:hypothetical protein